MIKNERFIFFVKKKFVKLQTSIKTQPCTKVDKANETFDFTYRICVIDHAFFFLKTVQNKIMILNIPVWMDEQDCCILKPLLYINFYIPIETQ